MAKKDEKKINCMLPGAELLEQGKSVKEVMATLEKEKHAGGRPPKFAKPEDMQKAIDDYFESCFQIVEIKKGEGEAQIIETKRVQSRPYTVMGLALALNLSRQGLCEYAEKGEFSDIVKRAKQTVELNVEELLIGGKNATGPIFWLKNHADYKDKQEVEQSGTITIEIVRFSDNKKIEPK